MVARPCPAGADLLRGRVDPDGNLHQFVTCKGGINDVKYCNPEVDTLLNDARKTPDAAARKVKYDAALKILNDDMPISLDD